MSDSTARWVSDLKIAARFVRSVQTGRAAIDIELQDLADQIDEIANQQTDPFESGANQGKPVERAA